MVECPLMAHADIGLRAANVCPRGEADMLICVANVCF